MVIQSTISITLSMYMNRKVDSTNCDHLKKHREYHVLSFISLSDNTNDDI